MRVYHCFDDLVLFGLCAVEGGLAVTLQAPLTAVVPLQPVGPGWWHPCRWQLGLTPVDLSIGAFVHNREGNGSRSFVRPSPRSTAGAFDLGRRAVVVRAIADGLDRFQGGRGLSGRCLLLVGDGEFGERLIGRGRHPADRRNRRRGAATVVGPAAGATSDKGWSALVDVLSS